MTRKRTVSKARIEMGYWQPVAIQDDFWLRTFVDFVGPLKGFYRDPASAGAHMLAAYIEDAATVEWTFTHSPDAYGALALPYCEDSARKVFARICAGEVGLTLPQCAEAFTRQCKASADIAGFAAAHPKLFWELQQERSAKKTKSMLVEVQFFGKSIYVEQRLPPKKITKVRLRSECK